MTSQDHDTDPSTPGAKRFSDPRTPAAVSVALVDDDPPPSGPRLSRANTDPGIAPPPGPLLPSPRPPAVVVPPVVAPPNDSVDMLLEGIRREQPDRPRTMPQTDGQAAATYHAEHSVRAARTSPDDEPKVVVDRPVLGETFRIARVVPAAPPPEVDVRAWADTVALAPQPVVGRVVVAIVAGLAVVAIIFVALQRAAGRSVLPEMGLPGATPVAESVSPAPPTPVETLAPPPALSVEAVDSPPATESEAAAPLQASALVNVAASAPAPVAPPRAAKPKLKPAAAAPRTKSSDLGEFKSSF